jgi:hypothetical protein
MTKKKEHWLFPVSSPSPTPPLSIRSNKYHQSDQRKKSVVHHLCMSFSTSVHSPALEVAHNRVRNRMSYLMCITRLGP